jgi:hypothetical protein
LRAGDDATALAALERMGGLRPEDKTFPFLMAYVLAASKDGAVRDVDRARRMLDEARPLKGAVGLEFIRLEIYVSLRLSKDADRMSAVNRLLNDPLLPPAHVHEMREFARAVITGGSYEMLPPLLTSE